MKIPIILFLWLVGVHSFVPRECNEKTSKGALYDCGDHGKPNFYRDENDVCRFTCLVNGAKKTCQEIHAVQDMSPFIRSRCKHLVFNCDEQGQPLLIDIPGFCRYTCLSHKEYLNCEQVHDYHLE
ncbi:hypothetical protein PPYR_12233 [Photinus pyralis]|uniref:Uncharacterized protein n=2 Tax=Photinus pyralis TaxID=7054 RepID=A0A5N4ADK0_PHOPY|nr:hypothetical protein PPYR_11399 [Photinus pyralis]KAB0795394.1 hypothetical protein PPYR_12233 [Photinus pyralis]